MSFCVCAEVLNSLESLQLCQTTGLKILKKFSTWGFVGTVSLCFFAQRVQMAAQGEELQQVLKGFKWNIWWAVQQARLPLQRGISYWQAKTSQGWERRRRKWGENQGANLQRENTTPFSSPGESPHSSPNQTPGVCVYVCVWVCMASLRFDWHAGPCILTGGCQYLICLMNSGLQKMTELPPAHPRLKRESSAASRRWRPVEPLDAGMHLPGMSTPSLYGLLVELHKQPDMWWKG